MLSPLSNSLSPLGLSKKYESIQTWDSYVASLEPLVWHRFNEPSGNIIDYGSAGVDAILSGDLASLYQQPGQLGATEAVRIPGGFNWFEFPFSAGWANESAWEINMLMMIFGSTGLNQRIFGPEGSVGNDTANITRQEGLGGRMLFLVPAAGGGGSSTTNEVLPIGSWHLLSFNYDNLGDRNPRVFIDAVECTYSSQIAVTGTYINFVSGGAWGGNPVVSRSIAGFIDEGIFSRILTTTERQTLVTLAGL